MRKFERSAGAKRLDARTTGQLDRENKTREKKERIIHWSVGEDTGVDKKSKPQAAVSEKKRSFPMTEGTV